MAKLAVTKTLNKQIPSEINKLLTKELTNYLVIKDGFVIINKIAKNFAQLQITSEVNKLKIIVPKNFCETATFHVFNLFGKNSSNSEVEIVLNENAELTYFEYLANFEGTTVNLFSNTVLFDNAKLTYTGITNFNESGTINVIRNSFISAYGQCFYTAAEVSTGETNVKTIAYLNGEGASATVKTVAIASKKQVVNIKQLIVHNAPNTAGYIENYGVANDQSTLSFEGIGKINKKMVKSIARQINRGIVLGEKATLEASPLLLIDEYDVEASHGAAIGKIDEEQLYYLMSRGLTLKAAERLIITGFLSPVTANLSTAILKENFMQMVNKKIS